MKRKLSATVAFLFLAMGLAPNLAHAQQPDSRPSVVFILADDLGYGDIKSFGLDRCQIDTPNFDRLAAEGMRFTDAHAIASVCVPSRIGIMTGRYALRFDPGGRGGPWGFLGPRLAAEQFTLGTMLRASGYRTGYVGKWHLGTTMTTFDGKTQGPDNVDYSKPLKSGPPQYGFDDSFILPGSLDMYPYAFVRNNAWVGQVTAQKGWSAFNRVGPAAEDFLDTKVLDTFSREAERFIRENAANAKQGKPFFLYLALTAPHTPISPRAEFEGQSRIGVYGDFVMETDDCIGRVLAALETHGLAENTLVIATSDHGPAPYAGRERKATAGQNKELQKEGHYSGGIYRGYKFSVYEGAFRVPYAVRWPAVVAAGQTCGRLIGLNDLMATLAEIAGHDLGEHQAADSVSLLPLFKNPLAEPVRKSMILQAPRAYAIRSGPWKLAFCPGSGSPGRWGNTPASGEAWEQAVKAYGRHPVDHAELIQAPFVQLFNLDDDPGETKNLAAGAPEKVRELHALFQEQVDRGRDTPGPALKNDRDNIKAFPGVPRSIFKDAADAAKASPIRVVVWDEQQDKQKQVYENFLGNHVAEFLRGREGLAVQSVRLDDPDQGLSDSILDACDVLVWWGHVRNRDVSAEKGRKIVARIKAGQLSLIALHSAHWSAPFVEAMHERARMDARRKFPDPSPETPVQFTFVPPPRQYTVPAHGSILTPAYYPNKIKGKLAEVRVDLPNCCFPDYRADGEPSVLHVEDLSHPIATGLTAQFTIHSTEMYNEPFHVPEPDEVVFKETWKTGEWFRSGMVWNIGQGKVFYFRPGHETFPVFKQAETLKVIENAVRWLGQKG